MMLVLTIAISRLVPLLFLASAVLVASRYLYDRYAVRNRWIAKGVMISIIAVGFILATPMAMRAYAVTLAEVFYLRHVWAKADQYFQLYTRLDGKCGDLLATDWVQALMNQQKWREAEAVLLSNIQRKGDRVTAKPENVLRLGICRYYDKRISFAERTFLALPDEMGENYLKFYFLGRIAEIKKDMPEAVLQYTKSMNASPHFFPAVYQSVRLHLLSADQEAARRTLDRFTSGKKITENRWFDACEAAVRNGVVPDQMEFMIVQVSN